MRTSTTTPSQGTPSADREEVRPSESRRGFILMAVGLWLLINTLDLFGLSYDTSWPLLLVLIGTATLLAPKSGEAGRRPRPGLSMILFGVLAWLAVNGVWGLSWGTVWPLFLVGGGLLIVLRALGDQRGARS